jgi:uncharacterized protein (TIGR02246 family)
MSHNAEQDIRALFNDWFVATNKKDLDATMSHISDDVESFEHEAPLMYRGVEALRETCARGFEVMEGELEWSIPDLRVIVRDDIAVTWGVNVMKSVGPDGTATTLTSRGTRVFQKFDEEWSMIHQHVSFPFDPDTGDSVMNLPVDTSSA